MYTIYTLQKALKFTLETFNTHSMKRFHSVRNSRPHTQTEWSDIWPHTAHFYNERISTDPILVTWPSTVPWRWF